MSVVLLISVGFRWHRLTFGRYQRVGPPWSWGISLRNQEILLIFQDSFLIHFDPFAYHKIVPLLGNFMQDLSSINLNRDFVFITMWHGLKFNRSSRAAKGQLLFYFRMWKYGSFDCEIKLHAMMSFSWRLTIFGQFYKASQHAEEVWSKITVIFKFHELGMLDFRIIFSVTLEHMFVILVICWQYQPFRIVSLYSTDYKVKVVFWNALRFFTI